MKQKATWAILGVLLAGTLFASGGKTDDLAKKLEALEKRSSTPAASAEADGEREEKASAKAAKKEKRSKRDEIAEREVTGVYYLPPEIKVSPDERARVIGSVRKRMNEREATEAAAKGKTADLEKKKAQLEERQAAKKKKAEDDFQKHMAQYEKEQKIKAVEKTLGIDSSEEYSAEYDGMSPEMANIVKRNKELDKTYQTKVGN